MAEGLVVSIRTACEQDLPAMEWDGEYRRFRRLYQTAIAEAKMGRRVILVAEVDGSMAGQVFVQLGTSMAILSDGPSTGYFYAFRVRPPYRNRGIGTRLIQVAESEARGRRYRYAAISVAKDNPRARMLYERLGYQVVGEDPGEWSYVDDEGQLRSIREPAYVLEKQL